MPLAEERAEGGDRGSITSSEKRSKSPDDWAQRLAIWSVNCSCQLFMKLLPEDGRPAMRGR